MRSTIKDFLATGDIIVGECLVHKISNSKEIIKVFINSDGYIEFSDGSIFKSPSSAAKYATGRKTVNGWKFWKIQRTSKYLDDLRNA